MICFDQCVYRYSYDQICNKTQFKKGKILFGSLFEEMPFEVCYQKHEIVTLCLLPGSSFSGYPILTQSGTLARIVAPTFYYGSYLFLFSQTFLVTS